MYVHDMAENTVKCNTSLSLMYKVTPGKRGVIEVLDIGTYVYFYCFGSTMFLCHCCVRSQPLLVHMTQKED